MGRTADTNTVSAAGPFVLSIRVVQLLWLGCVALTVARWRRVTVAGKLLLFVPVALLVPHVFVELYVYYPRHVIAGYLTMGVAAAYVCSGAAELSATLTPAPGAWGRRSRGRSGRR